MPSPDFSQYVDLTTFDVQPPQLYEQAVIYARTALPEFNPRPGTLEDAIVQAGALVGASTIGAVNRLPDELMEGILRVMGIERTEATESSVEVQFNLYVAGETVPEDTVYAFDYFNGVETIQYPFVLKSPVTAGVGETTVTATLDSLILGQIPSFSVGTQLVPNSPSSVVFSCETIGEVTQGQSAETEAEFLNRAVTYLQSLSATLNTATQVENYILGNYAEVVRVKAYDLVKATEHRTSSSNSSHTGFSASVNTSSAFYASASAYPGTIYRMITPQFYGDAVYAEEFASGTFTTTDDSLTINSSGTILYDDAVSDTASAGPAVDVVLLDPLLLSYTESSEEPGQFVVFVCGQDGEPVGRAVRQAIEEDIAERVPAGLEFKVLDAWTYDLSFTLTVGVSPGYNATNIGQAVRETIEDLVSPNNWPNFESKVRVYEIVAAASNVVGVSYVSSIEAEIPVFPDSLYGNEKLVEQITAGTQLTAFGALYAGLLPRASVEVITL